MASSSNANVLTEAEKAALAVRPRNAGYIQIADRQFTTVAAASNYINALDAREQYEAQSDVLEKLLVIHDFVGDTVEEFYGYVKDSEAYRLHMSVDEFKNTWSAAETIVDQNAARRDKQLEAQRNIASNWGGPRATSWVDQPNHSQTFLAAVRKLAAVFTFDEAALRINNAIIARLETPSRGVSQTKCCTTGDVVKAVAEVNGSGEIGSDIVEKHGLRYGAQGILELNDGTALIAIPSDDPSHDHVEQGGEVNELGAVDFPGPAGERIRPIRTRHSRRLIARGINRDPGFLLGHPDDDEVDEEVIEDAQDLLDDEDDDDGHTEAVEGSRKRRRLDGSKASRAGGCSCSGDVPPEWKATIMKPKIYGLATDLKLLSRWSDYAHVCHAHSKAMGGHLGLQVKKLNHTGLTQRLREVHDNQYNIGKLKTDSTTFNWFRKASRPARPSDSLGPYKFAHATSDAFHFNQDEILDSIDRNLRATWEKDGTIRHPAFEWWFTSPIANIVTAEYDMYHHHLREINGKSNNGWLRNMFYSIGQQLMRQDPLYYMLYVALRKDKNWRLISYPYYAKYNHLGDSSFFRHIDLNIPGLVYEGRGENMIQGTLSLDDEDDANCTEMLLGMKRHLKDWWELCVERGVATDGFVHRFEGPVFTKADSIRFGIDWVPTPCKKGDVRISIPHLPHGATGPATRVRRTMFPWFVGIQDDNESLEVIEGGTWSDLSRAHRDLMAPKATPSGLANRYGAIPYKFPAAVEVTGLGGLSDALCGRIRWTSPLAINDRNVILGSDREAAWTFIIRWREVAIIQANAAFQLVVSEERRLFGDKSYFFHAEKRDLYGTPIPELFDDADDVDSDADRAEEGEGIRFAEDVVQEREVVE